jgi:hypothetical protein
LKFYKPDSSEFIDPEVQLNRNWDIADPALKRLLEYEYTTTSVPNVVNSVDRARFYKTYSNSFMAYFKSGNFFYQDPNAFVSTWVSAKSLLQPGWIEHPDMPLFYRQVKKTGGSITTIEWIGAFQNNSQVTIDVNTNMTVMDVDKIPVGIRPVTAKYFTAWGGNTSSNYSIARLFFGSNGTLEMKRYGSNPSSPGTENRIELTGVKYNVEVTGA